MKASVAGKFAFMSSRNNNFSNRDQTGVICVRGKKADGSTENCNLTTTQGVLQDTNIALSTNKQERMMDATARVSKCLDEANSASSGTANDQGATSCITLSTGGDADILSTESFTTEQAANDVMGDGDLKSCEEISFFYGGSSATTALVGLAIGLAFVGFAAAWASVFCYNRIRARQEMNKETKFAGKKHWKKSTGDSQVI
jgi:hypothetical protein